MKRPTLISIQLLVIYSLLVSILRIDIVEASRTICIRADGSIDPPTAPIQRHGDIYTLVGNFTSNSDGIVIERSNMTLDGVGYILQGADAYDSKAIYLSNMNNITIKNTNIRGFDYGIYIIDSYGHCFSGNNITNNYWGIWIESSSNNIISTNNVINNRDGIYLSSSFSNIVSGNNIANKDYGVCLGVSTSNIISGNNITNNYHGINFCESPSDNTISENNITNNHVAIYLTDLANNNVMFGNNITNNHVAIYFYKWAFSNKILRNDISNNYYGICMDRSSHNNFSANIISSNRYSFDVKGYEMRHFLHSFDTSNLMDGKRVYYWVNRHEEFIPLDAGYVVLVNCTGVTVRNLVLQNTVQGLLLAFTQNSYVSNNTMVNNYEGVCLYWSPSNIISGNTIVRSDLCVFLQSSSNNTFYHNNFIDNRRQIWLFSSTNFWDNGYPTGGNYWSNYIGVDADNDGIGDTAYAAGGIIDRYPLMYPTSEVELPTQEQNPLLVQWWFWIIVATMVASIVLTLFLRRRKVTKDNHALEHNLSLFHRSKSLIKIKIDEKE